MLEMIPAGDTYIRSQTKTEGIGRYLSAVVGQQQYLVKVDGVTLMKRVEDVEVAADLLEQDEPLEMPELFTRRQAKSMFGPRQVRRAVRASRVKNPGLKRRMKHPKDQ